MFTFRGNISQAFSVATIPLNARLKLDNEKEIKGDERLNEGMIKNLFVLRVKSVNEVKCC